MALPVAHPIKPMLAKPVKTIPEGMCYEPKWDGFRAIIFRDGDQVEIGSRNERPLTRYFPEVVEAVLAHFPNRCVVDGEIVLISADRRTLDFEALQQRIHPAASRISLLSQQTPASFVAFDLLALDDRDLRAEPFADRRKLLEEQFAEASAPIHVTPATRSVDEAADWFDRYEGAGLDGLIAKPADQPYVSDKRTMFKIKHTRTADCVVAGYRVHKSGPDRIGSLLLGLYNDTGELASVGVIGSFTATRRAELFTELQPLVVDVADHPWAWAEDVSRQTDASGARSPRKSEGSRWNNGKDLSFVPLRIELVVEAKYDFMEGTRFRHTAQFVRWRTDRAPESCTFEQLEVPVEFDLAEVLPPSGGVGTSL